MEVGANLGLASVDHVIERLIMTVIETCSVGAVVCVSKKKEGTGCDLGLTRGLPLPHIDRRHYRLYHKTRDESPLSVRFGKFSSPSSGGARSPDLLYSSQPQGRIYT